MFHLLSKLYERTSIAITTNLSFSEWSAIFGDPTYADAILDRLIHSATRIDPNGESLVVPVPENSEGLTAAPFIATNLCQQCAPRRGQSCRNTGRHDLGTGGHLRRNLQAFLSLEERDAATGLYYADFSDRFVLKEVIIGAQSSVTRSQLRDADGGHARTLLSRMIARRT